jgi:hypothetical protein
LANLPHTWKKDKIEKTFMRFITIFFYVFFNYLLHGLTKRIRVSLLRVLLCLYIGATFVNFSGLLVCPPQRPLWHLTPFFEEDRLPFFPYCRPCHPEQKFLVRSPVQPCELHLKNWHRPSMNYFESNNSRLQRPCIGTHTFTFQSSSVK